MKFQQHGWLKETPIKTPVDKLADIQGILQGPSLNEALQWKAANGGLRKRE